MLNLLANHYQLLSTPTRYMPLDLAVVSLDYYLYLFRVGGVGYVIVETDYLSGMPGIVADVERVFDVRVTGWCVRNDRRRDGQPALLPPDADDYDPDGTNDANHNNYVDAVCSEHGMRYAVLQVEIYKPTDQSR